MKTRLVLSFIVAGVVALTCGVLPAAAQESAQTVRASIPPQGPVPPKPAVQPPAPQLAPSLKGSGEAEAANVKIEVTITYQVGNAAPVRRTATLTIADQGRGYLRSGNQVAVPSTSYQPVNPSIKPDAGMPAVPAPLTSFNYKSVGLNVDAGNVYIQGNKAKLLLSVEFSAIDEKSADLAGRPPSFPTFSENLSLVLESGKPLIVGESSDYVGNVERKQSVEVKATILR